MRFRTAKYIAERAGLDYAAIRAEHRAAWKWTVGGEWYTQPYLSTRGVGFDVTCKCGWESRTGGAIKVRVEEDHERHLMDVVLGIIESKQKGE